MSIAAEIVANRRGGSGLPLTGAHTLIHHDATARHRLLSVPAEEPGPPERGLVSVDSRPDRAA